MKTKQIVRPKDLKKLLKECSRKTRILIAVDQEKNDKKEVVFFIHGINVVNGSDVYGIINPPFPDGKSRNDEMYEFFSKLTEDNVIDRMIENAKDWLAHLEKRKLEDVLK